LPAEAMVSYQGRYVVVQTAMVQNQMQNSIDIERKDATHTESCFYLVRSKKAVHTISYEGMGAAF
jgi:hypothetical protein